MLHGSDTKPWLIASAQYMADHVPNARIHQIPGAGHIVPLTRHEVLAEALTAFFAPGSSRPDPCSTPRALQYPRRDGHEVTAAAQIEDGELADEGERVEGR